MDDRVVIGPLFTHAGFQAWFLVCTTRGIIAMPMGLGFALSTNRAALLLIGGIAGALLSKRGAAAQAQALERFHRLSDTELLAQKGKVICRTPELASVALKRKPLSNSEVIVTNRRGEQRVFGILNPGDFSKFGEVLATKYGERFLRA